MASYLKTVEYNIRKLNSDDEDKLVDILENANKMMLREHQDWRAYFLLEMQNSLTFIFYFTRH